MESIEVSSNTGRFERCAVGGFASTPDSEYWIVDDIELDFQQQAAPVPDVSPVGGIVLTLLIGLLGGVLLSGGRG